MHKLKIYLIAILVFQINTGVGQIKLPRLISDGMVLQCDAKTNLWGWASPGEEVRLEFNNQFLNTKADEEGKWRMELAAQKPGGPYVLNFTASNEIRVENVVFGEVWVCSGQSNMELWMGRVKEKYLDVIADSENHMIRQFMVPDQYDFNKEHHDLDEGEWILANPESVLNFSAVAYFLARELNDQYKVPIGLINAAMGGSPVEAWMSEETLKKFPEAYNEMQQFKDDHLIKSIEAADKKRSNSWYKVLNEMDLGLGSKPSWNQLTADDSNWKTITIPGYWTDDESNGVYWFRRELHIPEKHVGKSASLWLGRIVDQDFAYVNGHLVGTTGYQYPPRRYNVDSLILVKNNTLAVRIISQRGRGGFVPDKPYYLAVDGDTFDISGKWKCRKGTSMKPLESQTFVRWKPGGLYNKMISPLTDYSIKGVIWYQGESNVDNPDNYHEAFSAMINNWRTAWNQGEFPFLYVQLANFMEETDEPVESDWAKLRQGQLETLSVSNTGMVVAIDLGERNDIHPLNKKDVGYRLSLLARKMAYNEKWLMASSPIPEEAEFHNNHVMIGFDHRSGQLKTRDNEPLRSLAISNDGIHYSWAEAEITGNKIKVWNENILNPISVRYAWSDNPANANLISLEGLPASPFQMNKQ